MDTSKESRIAQVREALGKQPAAQERWRSQLKIVADRITSFSNVARLLEIGCGSGAIRDYLPARIHYSGIDPIECAHATFDFKIGYAENIPHAEGVFDLVLVKDAVNYFRELEPVMSEAFRVLKTNGAVLLTEDVGATYRPGTQKLKNLLKKHLHLRRNIWDKTYSNFYTSHDVMAVANKLGFSTRYQYTPSDLRYFVTIARLEPSD